MERNSHICCMLYQKNVHYDNNDDDDDDDDRDSTETENKTQPINL